MLVVERASGEVAGLVILFETLLDQGIEVRLGYLLAPPFWGKGLASELVSWLVRWCRAQDGIDSLAGGVSVDNPASRRVLEKNGFLHSERGEGEDILRLTVGE